MPQKNLQLNIEVKLDSTSAQQSLRALAGEIGSLKVPVSFERSSSDAIGQQIADAVGNSLKNIKLPGQGGFFSGLINTVTAPIQSVFTGAFEGVGREFSRELGKGALDGIRRELAPVIGSFELVGREGAAALTRSLISQFSKEADQVRSVVRKFAGDQAFFAEVGASQAQVQRRQSRRIVEGTKFSQRQRVGKNVETLAAERQDIESEYVRLESDNARLQERLELLGREERKAERDALRQRRKRLDARLLQSNKDLQAFEARQVLGAIVPVEQIPSTVLSLRQDAGAQERQVGRASEADRSDRSALGRLLKRRQELVQERPVLGELAQLAAEIDREQKTRLALFKQFDQKLSVLQQNGASAEDVRQLRALIKVDQESADKLKSLTDKRAELRQSPDAPKQSQESARIDQLIEELFRARAERLNLLNRITSDSGVGEVASERDFAAALKTAQQQFQVEAGNLQKLFAAQTQVALKVDPVKPESLALERVVAEISQLQKLRIELAEQIAKDIAVITDGGDYEKQIDEIRISVLADVQAADRLDTLVAERERLRSTPGIAAERAESIKIEQLIEELLERRLKRSLLIGKAISDGAEEGRVRNLLSTASNQLEAESKSLEELLALRALVQPSGGSGLGGSENPIYRLDKLINEVVSRIEKRQRLIQQVNASLEITLQQLSSVEAQAAQPKIAPLATSAILSEVEELKSRIPKLQDALIEAVDRGDRVLARKAQEKIDLRQRQIDELSKLALKLDLESEPDLQPAGGVQGRANAEPVRSKSSEPQKAQKSRQEVLQEIYEQIFKQVVAASGVKAGKEQIPRLALVDKFSGDHVADYTGAGLNTIRILKDTAERISDGTASRDELGLVVHELRHAVQVYFGKFRRSQVDLDSLLKATDAELKASFGEIEFLINQSTEGFQRINPEATSVAVARVRALEEDAYTFTARYIDQIYQSLGFAANAAVKDAARTPHVEQAQQQGVIAKAKQAISGVVNNATRQQQKREADSPPEKSGSLVLAQPATLGPVQQATEKVQEGAGFLVKAVKATARSTFGLAQDLEEVVLEILPFGKALKVAAQKFAIPAAIFTAATHALPGGQSLAGLLEGALSSIVDPATGALAANAAEIATTSIQQAFAHVPFGSQIANALVDAIVPAINAAKGVLTEALVSGATAVIGGKAIQAGGQKALNAAGEKLQEIVPLGRPLPALQSAEYVPVEASKSPANRQLPPADNRQPFEIPFSIRKGEEGLEVEINTTRLSERVGELKHQVSAAVDKSGQALNNAASKVRQVVEDKTGLDIDALAQQADELKRQATDDASKAVGDAIRNVKQKVEATAGTRTIDVAAVEIVDPWKDLPPAIQDGASEIIEAAAQAVPKELSKAKQQALGKARLELATIKTQFSKLQDSFNQAITEGDLEKAELYGNAIFGYEEDIKEKIQDLKRSLRAQNLDVSFGSPLQREFDAQGKGDITRASKAAKILLEDLKASKAQESEPELYAFAADRSRDTGAANAAGEILQQVQSAAAQLSGSLPELKERLELLALVVRTTAVDIYRSERVWKTLDDLIVNLSGTLASAVGGHAGIVPGLAGDLNGALVARGAVSVGREAQSAYQDLLQQEAFQTASALEKLQLVVGATAVRLQSPEFQQKIGRQLTEDLIGFVVGNGAAGAINAAAPLLSPVPLKGAAVATFAVPRLADVRDAHAQRIENEADPELYAFSARDFAAHALSELGKFQKEAAARLKEFTRDLRGERLELSAPKTTAQVEAIAQSDKIISDQKQIQEGLNQLAEEIQQAQEYASRLEEVLAGVVPERSIPDRLDELGKEVRDLINEVSAIQKEAVKPVVLSSDDTEIIEGIVALRREAEQIQAESNESERRILAERQQAEAEAAAQRQQELKARRENAKRETEAILARQKDAADLYRQERFAPYAARLDADARLQEAGLIGANHAPTSPSNLILPGQQQLILSNRELVLPEPELASSPKGLILPQNKQDDVLRVEREITEERRIQEEITRSEQEAQEEIARQRLESAGLVPAVSREDLIYPSSPINPDKQLAIPGQAQPNPEAQLILPEPKAGLSRFEREQQVSQIEQARLQQQRRKDEESARLRQEQVDQIQRARERQQQQKDEEFARLRQEQVEKLRQKRFEAEVSQTPSKPRALRPLPPDTYVQQLGLELDIEKQPKKSPEPQREPIRPPRPNSRLDRARFEVESRVQPLLDRAGAIFKGESPSYAEAAKKGFTGLKDSLTGAGGKLQQFGGALGPVNKGLKFLIAHAKEAVIGFIAFQVLGQATDQIIRFGQESFKTASEIDSLQTSLTFAAGSQRAAAEQIQFIREESSRLKTPLKESIQGFQQLAAATKGTAFEGKRTQEVYTALAQAARVNSLSQQDFQGLLLATTQVFGKGSVQAEELRGQIGERLPGAFEKFAKALGISTGELNKRLDLGTVGIDDFGKFLNQLATDSLPGVGAALRTPQAALDGLGNQFTTFQEQVGKAITPAALIAFNLLSGLLKGIGDVLSSVGKAFEGLHTILGALKVTDVVSALFKGLAAVLDFTLVKTGLLTAGLKALAVVLAVAAAPTVFTALVTGLSLVAFGIKSAALAAGPFLPLMAALTAAMLVTQPVVRTLGNAFFYLKEGFTEARLAALQAGEIFDIKFNEAITKLQRGIPLTEDELKSLKEGFQANVKAGLDSAHTADVLTRRLEDLQAKALSSSGAIDKLNKDIAKSGLAFKLSSAAVEQSLLDRKASIAEALASGSKSADQARAEELQAEAQHSRDLVTLYANRQAEVSSQLEERKRQIAQANRSGRDSAELVKSRQELEDQLIEISKQAAQSRSQVVQSETAAANQAIEQAEAERQVVTHALLNQGVITEEDANLQRLQGTRARIFQQIQLEGDSAQKRLELAQNEKEQIEAQKQLALKAVESEATETQILLQKAANEREVNKELEAYYILKIEEARLQEQLKLEVRNFAEREKLQLELLKNEQQQREAAKAYFLREIEDRYTAEQIAIQAALNNRAITQDKASQELLDVERERLEAELALNQDNVQERARLTLELLKNEEQQQEKLRELAIQRIETTLQAEENAVQRRQAVLNAVQSSLEQQNRLLEARRSLLGSIENLTNSVFEAAKRLAKDPEQRKQIEEDIARSRLNGLLKAQDIEQKIFELKLKQEESQRRIALEQNKAEVLKAAAEREKIYADPRATNLQKQAADAGVVAALAQREALQEAQGQAEQIANYNRQEQQNARRAALIPARLDLAEKTQDPRERDALIRSTRNEVTRILGIDVGGNGFPYYSLSGTNRRRATAPDLPPEPASLVRSDSAVDAQLRRIQEQFSDNSRGLTDGFFRQLLDNERPPATQPPRQTPQSNLASSGNVILLTPSNLQSLIQNAPRVNLAGQQQSQAPQRPAAQLDPAAVVRDFVQRVNLEQRPIMIELTQNFSPNERGQTADRTRAEVLGVLEEVTRGW